MDASGTFGYWVRRRRKALDLTQDELAQRVGCAAITLRKIEADERRPSPEMAARLAQALELAPEEHTAFLTMARTQVWDDAAEDPPPLVPPAPVSPATTHHNFPLPLTPFIGREEHVAALQRLLAAPQPRLITLTGPGGGGKTRLALQVAREVVESFGDGVWFVDLAPVQDPALVGSAIATALGVTETAGQSIQTSLQAYLRPRQALLVLDNFEHVVPAAPLLRDLLARAGDLKLLVTSREVLRLYGEQDYQVPPLALPDPRQLPPLKELSRYEAVTLFVQQARAARRDFRLTNENAATVAAICARLDGLPLALELAAARTKMFTPTALLQRLASRLTLLSSHTRDRQARQQTLRGAIGWSYDLLEPVEQILFARLAVFAGGCALEAVEAVSQAVGERSVDVLDGLQSLVDKSLLQLDTRAHQEPRFTMLETIREYALERLTASGEAEAVQRQHATYFVVLAEQASPELFSPHLDTGRHKITWLRRLEAERDNLRAAFQWVVDWKEVELGLRLGWALKPFWYLQGGYSEGRHWLEAALALGGDVPTREQERLRVKVLHAAGEVAAWQGDTAHWTLRLEQSLAVARELGDTGGCAAALFDLGRTAYAEGNARQAQTLLEESLALYQAVSDTYGQAMALSMLGAVAREQGDDRLAMALLEQSLALIREGGTTRQIADTLWEAGELARRHEETRQARELLEESLALFRVVEDPWATGCLLNVLGILACQEGDATRATRLLQEGLTQFRALGHAPGMWGCLMGLVRVACGQGQLGRAARLAGAADALGAAIDSDRAQHLTPADHSTYDHDRAAVRAALSEQSFAAAWTEGRRMPLEQAIAYALSDET